MRCPLFFLLLFPAFLFANGGPIDAAALFKTGNICPLRYHNAQLVREDLSLRLVGDYTEVHARYQLSGGIRGWWRTDTVLYGFPVDFLELDSDEQFAWEDDYVPEFSIAQDSVQLPVHTQLDYSLLFDSLPGGSVQTKMRKWYLTNIIFPKDGHNVVIEVKYRFKNQADDWAFSKEFFAHYTDRKFLYVFESASYWGNEKVGLFHLTIDDSDILRNAGSVHTSGVPVLRNAAGVWEFEQPNIDFLKLETLYIRYDNSAWKQSADITRFRFSTAQIGRPAVSSTLSGGNYASANLVDGDFSTAWVEGAKNNGAGEWIEFTLPDTFSTGALILLSGYAKSAETYRNNNRLKTIEIFTTGVDSEEGAVSQRDTLKFEDLAWYPATPDNFAGLSQLVDLWSMDIWFHIQRIRITILETYPGAKYNDTCISEIMFCGE